LAVSSSSLDVANLIGEAKALPLHHLYSRMIRLWKQLACNFPSCGGPCEIEDTLRDLAAHAELPVDDVRRLRYGEIRQKWPRC
jgi:hypothetical protein